MRDLCVYLRNEASQVCVFSLGFLVHLVIFLTSILLLQQGSYGAIKAIVEVINLGTSVQGSEFR